MKKLICLLILISAFALCGCEQRTNYEFIHNKNQISKIEIIIVGEIKNPHNLPLSQVQPEMTIITELSTSDTDEFLRQFIKMECYQKNSDPGYLFPETEGIKITYLNGDYEIIALDAQGIYINGSYKNTGYYYFKRDQFQELMNIYLVNQ